MIVVDTNVIAYLYLTSEHSREAEAVLRVDPEWAAPQLWRSELRSVLAAQIRQRRMSLADAGSVMDAARDRMHGGEYDVPSGPVLAVAARTGCSACDCEFAVLALELGVRLVTADRELLAAFPDAAVALAEFAGGERQP